MANDLATTSRSSIAAADGGLQLRSFDDMWRFAVAVASSGMAPRGMTKPEAVLVALEYGAELGLRPMQALSSIAVVNGRPCLWGDGLKAVVEASPLCEWVHERLEGEGEQLVAVCEAKRAGRPEPCVRRFSFKDAKQAGLLSKDTYKQYLGRMLQMRARSWCLRDQFADLLCGLAAAEEVADMPRVAPEPVQVLEIGATQPDDDMDLVAETVEPVSQRDPFDEVSPVASGPDGEALFDMEA